MDNQHTNLGAAQFMIFSNYSRDIVPSVYTTGTVKNITGTIIKIEEPQVLSITMPKPEVDIPGAARYGIQVNTSNPNVQLDVLTSVDDILGSTLNTVTIQVNASIAVDSQTPWYPEITSGYYYLSTKEYYVFGESTIAAVNNGNGVYTCKPMPKYGSPIIVIDSNGNSLRYISENLNISEIIPVINNKFAECKYTGIDPTTITMNGAPLNGASIINNIIVLPSNISDDNINVTYKLLNAFSVKENTDSIEITTNGGSGHKIYYETGDRHVAYSVDLNPLRNPIPVGFIYVKD